MRKYMRKTQTKWSVINLRGAMNAVLSKKMGYKKASDLFHVPKTTLIRYIKKFKTANQPEPSTEDHPSNSEVNPRSKLDSSLSQPSSAKLQKKSERQMAFTESIHPARTQIHIPQHLQVAFPTTGPDQPTFRQEQTLAPPIQVAMVKSKPIEKPRPREKRLLAIANHQRNVMSNLASLWKSGKLCDAGIGNGSTTVKVHKVVLSAVCPKLLSVFSADFFSQKFLQVNFPEEVSKEALKAFAEYMYRGVLDLDCNILEQLKIIAKRLDMKEFEELCESHLPNYMHQPTSTTGSFTNFPVGQTAMPNLDTPSSLGFAVSPSSIQSTPSITTQVIDVKQEISEAEMAQVKQDTAAVFGQESEVELLAPNKCGNSAGFIISPSVKTELVGPDDSKYGQWSGNSNNQTFTSTNPSYPSPSSSSVEATTASTSIMSIPASSTEFSIPFLEETNVKTPRLKVPQCYEPPLVSNLYPVSGIDGTVHSQINPINDDTSKSLGTKPISMLSIADQSTNNEVVYPVGLFTAGGDSLPLLTTPTVDINTIDLYETDMT